MAVNISDFKKFPEFRLLIIALLAIALIYLFGLVWGVVAHFSDLLLLVFLSWLLSFLLEPLIARLTRFSFSRAVSSLLVYAGLVLLFLAAGLLLIPRLTNQLALLTVALPEYLANSPAWMARFQEALTSVIGLSANLITMAISLVSSTLIVMILSFYFSLDRRQISQEILSLMPKAYRDEALFVSGVINHSFAQFFRVQVIFGVIAGLFTWLVMLALGIQYAAVAAFLAGLLAMIPLVGPLLSLIPPVVLGFLQEPTRGLAIFIVLSIFQAIQYNVFGPKLFGSAFKIHPIIVFLSFFVGFKLAGIWGSFFAVPVISILAIMGKELWKHWLVRDLSA